MRLFSAFRSVWLFSAMVITSVTLSCSNSNSDEENENKGVGIESAVKSGSAPEHLNVATFKQKVWDYSSSKEWKFNGDLPCIVDFYADWCGPCKMIAPILEDLANQYKGKIHVYKINTDQQPELASLFNVKSIPTLLFCPKDGQPNMAMGALPKQTFEEAIHQLLLKDQPVKK